MPTNHISEKLLPISVKNMDFNTGTWTFASNSGVPKVSKSAAAETTVVTIPIMIPRQDAQYGAKLKSIKVPLRVTTANLSSTPTITLYQTNRYKAVAAGNVDIDATTIASSHDAVVTASANDRLITVTVTSPAFENAAGAVNDISYQLVLSIPCAAGSVLSIYDAAAVIELAES
jgi:hypothetical protein